VPSRDEVLAKAVELVDLAQKAGITLRLLGSAAVGLHCPRHAHLQAALGRPITDLDFLAPGKDNRQVREFLVGRGCIPDEEVFTYFGKSRHVYRYPDISLQVDIFFDELSFCHAVDFRNRLHLDSPTITATDILLEKMQIIKINLKDLIDTTILLLDHPVESHDNDAINVAYLISLLQKDWGFWYTFNLNLEKVRRYSQELATITREEKDLVEARVDEIGKALAGCPKTVQWRLRQRIGTRARWYNEVDEAEY